MSNFCGFTKSNLHGLEAWFIKTHRYTDIQLNLCNNKACNDVDGEEECNETIKRML